MTLDVAGTVSPPDLRAQLAEGSTLPADWYTTPVYLEREKKSIFARSWQFAGLAEDITQPGDFFTVTYEGVPLLLVRGMDRTIRAYINVCRHRGSQIVLAEAGSSKSIQCHYHAWTWNLDGSLRAAPGASEQASFVKEDFPLISIPVEIWGPFVFICRDRTAPPLRFFLGELPAMVDATGLPLNRVRRLERRTYDVAANWKIVMENYLECYHCPTAHPAFSDLIDVGDYCVETFDYFSTQGGPVKESTLRNRRSPYALRPGQGVKDGFYAYFWPNFALNIYPGPGNVSLNTIVPIDVNHTRMIYDFCFVEEVGATESSEFIAFVNQIQLEDTALCESVQRGMESGYWERGHLMLTREHGLQHFQRMVHDALLR